MSLWREKKGYHRRNIDRQGIRPNVSNLKFTTRKDILREEEQHLVHTFGPSSGSKLGIVLHKFVHPLLANFVVHCGRCAAERLKTDTSSTLSDVEDAPVQEILMELQICGSCGK